jgi:hypothetical protein
VLVALALGATPPAAGQQGHPVNAVLVQEIGLDETALVFDHVSGLAVGAQGQVIVAEPRLGLVRLIDSGTLQYRVLGGRGSGPGEFRTPTAVGLVGDSIWVWDPGLARLTLFDPDLGVAWTRSLPFVGSPVTPLAAGGFVGPGLVASAGSEPSRRLWIVDGDGENVRDSLSLRSGDAPIVLQSRGVRNQIWQPWSDATIWAASPRGDGFVVVDRPTTGPPVARVRRYDAAGREAWAVNVLYDPMPISRADIRAMAELISSGAREFAERRAIPIDLSEFSASYVARQLHVPARMPPVSAAVINTSGRVYLRGPVPPGSSEAVFRIVDSDGQVFSGLRLPEDFTLFHADDASLWGTRRDSQGRISVVHYRLEGGRQD